MPPTTALPRGPSAEDFVPLPGVRGGHAQTLAGTVLRRRAFLLPAERLVVEVEPGRRVLALWNGQPAPSAAGTVLLLHGLEGNAETGFMRGMAARALARGLNVLRMNMRSCGGTETLSGGGYHNGQHAAVQRVVEAAVSRWSLRDVAMCGYSMGGNMLLHLCASWGASPPSWARGVAVVCPAADLAACAVALHRPENRAYEAYFLAGLLSRTRRLFDLYPEQRIRIPRVPRSIYEFDDMVTAPLGSFAGAEDYYARCSSGPRLGQVRLPTLILHARDDPFVPFTSTVREAAGSNPQVLLVEPTRGGHCGFVAAGTERFWAEARCIDWAGACLVDGR